jgi:hypothetical protein
MGGAAANKPDTGSSLVYLWHFAEIKAWYHAGLFNVCHYDSCRLPPTELSGPTRPKAGLAAGSPPDRCCFESLFCCCFFQEVLIERHQHVLGVAHFRGECLCFGDHVSR